MAAKHNSGITIIELLIVVAIIGVSLALLLPAVQAAREAARSIQCQHNLRQIGLATLHHESSYKHFPTDGWGNQWLGDPDRGFSEGQPGGWIFNTLPFIEGRAIREMGRGLTVEGKRVASMQLTQTAISIHNCPSRRNSGLSTFICDHPIWNVDSPQLSAKSDYAVNGGDFVISGNGGPKSASAADLAAYQWPSKAKFSGISFVRSRVRASEILDGASKTYLIGEKAKSSSMVDYGDDQVSYMGDDADVRRWTANPPITDGSSATVHDQFGGPHSGGCYFAYCDGSVRLVTFEIDPEVHRQAGNRRDGNIVTISERQ